MQRVLRTCLSTLLGPPERSEGGRFLPTEERGREVGGNRSRQDQLVVFGTIGPLPVAYSATGPFPPPFRAGGPSRCLPRRHEDQGVPGLRE